jgi:type II secretory pathway component PulC
MINKIKDFLKNKFRRKEEDSSISQDMVDQEGVDFDPTNTSYKMTFSQKIRASLLRLKFRLNSSGGSFKKLNLRGMKLPKMRVPGKSDGSPILSPNMIKNIDKWLSPESREPIHQFSMVLLVCLITYSLGKMTALVLRGSPALENAKNFTVDIPFDHDFQTGTLNQVKSINIFRTGSGTGSKTKVADTKCEEASTQSTLPIKLINTVVLQDTIKSMASVQVRGGKELQEVREGDQIDNLAKIFKITRLELLIKNLENGVCESIPSDAAEEATSPISVMTPGESKTYKATKKMAGIENVGNKFIISKKLLDEKMKDIGSILTQARAVQIQNPDGTLSFKMTEMDPNGVFTYLGLQDQDIITSIDGKPIYDLNEVMRKFGNISNLDKMQLGIKREGSDSMQDYSIKK